MDEPRRVQHLLDRADTARDRGDYPAAIEACREALTIEPDHAVAHAVLALALLGARRPHAAAIEARHGLALAGDDPFCHLAMAAVLMAERKLEAAWEHCLVALVDDDVGVEARLVGAELEGLRGHDDEARELLEAALEREANHPRALVAMAQLELRLGRLDAAADRAAEALAAEPGQVEAHVVAGWIALARGDVDAAEEHARFALREQAGDGDALRLLVGIKARRSWLLGLWWRLNSYVTLRSDGQQVAMLIGSYVVAQLAIILAGALGQDGLADALGLGWILLCAYTWVAPARFRKMLEAELEKVTLRDDY